MPAGASRWWAPAYGTVLVLALTWPFFVPGEAFALRDMMVFDAMAHLRFSEYLGLDTAQKLTTDAQHAVSGVWS